MISPLLINIIYYVINTWNSYIWTVDLKSFSVIDPCIYDDTQAVVKERPEKKGTSLYSLTLFLWTRLAKRNWKHGSVWVVKILWRLKSKISNCCSNWHIYCSYECIGKINSWSLRSKSTRSSAILNYFKRLMPTGNSQNFDKYL